MISIIVKLLSGAIQFACRINTILNARSKKQIIRRQSIQNHFPHNSLGSTSILDSGGKVVVENGRISSGIFQIARFALSAYFGGMVMHSLKDKDYRVLDH